MASSSKHCSRSSYGTEEQAAHVPPPPRPLLDRHIYLALYLSHGSGVDRSGTAVANASCAGPVRSFRTAFRQETRGGGRKPPERGSASAATQVSDRGRRPPRRRRRQNNARGGRGEEAGNARGATLIDPAGAVRHCCAPNQGRLPGNGHEASARGSGSHRPLCRCR